MIKAKIIAHSSSETGVELITIQTEAPKFLDAEIEKHRMISTNSSSDRAVPVKKMLSAKVFIPSDIRKDQAGMQGNELFDEEDTNEIREQLSELRDHVEDVLSSLDNRFHVHKQHLNRYLLGFSMQSKVMTATRAEWNYFLKLRLNPAADPAIFKLAECIEYAIDNSVAIGLSSDEWHVPYVRQHEINDCGYSWEFITMLSVARCARVSYLNHDGSEPNANKDIELFKKLADMEHWSCFEHVAKPMRMDTTLMMHGVTSVRKNGDLYSGNFHDWIQVRHSL